MGEIWGLYKGPWTLRGIELPVVGQGFGFRVWGLVLVFRVWA